MGDPDFRQKLRNYLIREFREIEHPAEPFDVSRCLALDIESATDALLALLRLPTTVAEAQGLEKRVLSSLKQYLDAKGVETERRVHAVSSLVLRLEPFLKKLFALRYPNSKVPSRFKEMLQSDVVGYQSKELLHKPTEKSLLDALRLQRTEDAILHDAYCFRNIEAHEARAFLPAREQRCWRSVVAAFLLVAQRNIDLAPAIKGRMESAARIRSGLKVCLENVRGRFDDAKWRNEYYIPLTIDRDGKLDEHVTAFLRSQTDRLLVIAGRTGAGKSTFLERVATELANQALDVLGLEVPEHFLVPVHLEVKRYAPGKRKHLVKKLYDEFDPNRLLSIEGRRILSWPQILSPTGLVVCLDGLDEVPSTAYPVVVSEIEDLVADFENVKVIVTSRPHAVPDHWHKSLVHIAPLSREEVIAYFGHPEHLNLLAPDIQAFLEGKPDLIDILQDPLMAEAACRYWHQFEPPDLRSELDPSTRQEALLEGSLLDHLYQCFFTHHLRRAFGKQVTDYERVRQVSALAKLALEMDGDPFANFELIASAFDRFESGATTGESLLELFVDIGLLKPHDNEFAFRNDTVKAYFAAVGLRSHTRRKQNLEQALSLICQANQFWHRCVELLKQMAPLYDFSLIEGHLASLSEV